jgi:hypothetical protein
MNDTNIDTYDPIFEELHRITVYPSPTFPLFTFTAHINTEPGTPHLQK